MRVFAFLLIAALVGWLTVDTLSGSTKERAIRHALAEGSLGSLDAPRAEALRLLLSKWVADAGVKTEIAVNQPLRRGRLNVYTTTPNSAAITGVGLGNAAYDPELDAIFIDGFFLEPNPYLAMCKAMAVSSVVGCRDDMPSQRMVFAFIFLHELGHRQLHGTKSFAVSAQPDEPQSRRMENEADAYAFDKLRLMYRSGERVSGDSTGSLADAIGIQSSAGRRQATEADFWVDMPSALTVSSLLNVFLSLPYSPYYHDRAHPSLNDRTLQILDAALKQKDLPEEAVGALRSIRPVLVRQTKIPDLSFVEVRVPEPISNLALSADGLVVRTGGTGQLFRVDAESLIPLAHDHAPRVVQAAPIGPAITASGVNREFSEASVFWMSSPKGLLMVDDSNRTMRMDGGGLAASAFPVQTNNCFSIWPSQDEEGQALTFACDKGVDRFRVVSADAVLADRDVAAMNADVAAALKRPEVELQVLPFGCARPNVAVGGGQARAVVRSRANGNAQFVGTAHFKMPSLDTASMTALRLPSGSEVGGRQGSLFEAPTKEGDWVPMYVGSADGLPAGNWGLWKVFGDREPVLLAKHPYLVAESGDSEEAAKVFGGDFQVCDARGVLQGFVIVNIDNDGLYLVEPSTGQVSVLFSVGGSYLRFVARSKESRVALYISGTRKAYVFSLPR